MLRVIGVAGVILGFLSVIGSVQAQRITSVYTFGDSLSDAGNLAPILGPLGIPGPFRFTTKSDKVWSQIIAEAYGALVTPSVEGGPHYAVGGTIANPDSPCAATIPCGSLMEQVDRHLGTRGRADPNALYSVLIGSNDLDGILTKAAMQPGSIDAGAAVRAAAQAAVDQIRRLQASGARYIVVSSVPNIGLIPQLASLDEQSRELGTFMAGIYNRELADGLDAQPDGIISFNLFDLTNEIATDPDLYGLNVTDPACRKVDPGVAASLTCRQSALLVEPDADRTYLFADDQHPTGVGHEMLARTVIATIEAPLQVSLAGEAGIDAARAHRDAVFREVIADLSATRPAENWRVYTTAGVNRIDGADLPGLGKSSSDMQSVAVGATYRGSDGFIFGSTVSFGRHDTSVSGATLQGLTVIGSVHGTWIRDNLYISGMVSAGTTALEVERRIRLAAATRIESGTTAAAQFGGAIDAGLRFGETGGVRHGPFLGLAMTNQEIESYSEDGDSATAMAFSGFDRDSLIARGGYQLSIVFDDDAMRFQPYARIAYEQEMISDAVSVGAGPKPLPGHLPGRFTRTGVEAPEQAWTASFGLNVVLGGNASAVRAIRP